MKNLGFVGILLCCFTVGTPLIRVQAQEKKDPVPKPEATDKKKEEPKKEEARKEEPKSDKKEPKDELSETTNSVTINGLEITYRATAGTLVMKDEEGKPHATFFFVAYTRLGASVTNLSE